MWSPVRECCDAVTSSPCSQLESGTSPGWIHEAASLEVDTTTRLPAGKPTLHRTGNDFWFTGVSDLTVSMDLTSEFIGLCNVWSTDKTKSQVLDFDLEKRLEKNICRQNEEICLAWESLWSTWSASVRRRLGWIWLVILCTILNLVGSYQIVFFSNDWPL